VNEVISNRAIQIARGEMGSKTPIHPKDDVNMSQSSNDTFPAGDAHRGGDGDFAPGLLPAVKRLRDAIDAKAKEFKECGENRAHALAGRHAADGRAGISGWVSLLDAMEGRIPLRWMDCSISRLAAPPSALG